MKNVWSAPIDTFRRPFKSHCIQFTCVTIEWIALSVCALPSAVGSHINLKIDLSEIDKLQPLRLLSMPFVATD